MFLHPYILLLLILPLLLAAYQLRKSSGLPPRRAWSVTGLRLLALSAVIIALAQPLQRTSADRKQIVAVVDCSSSMGAADLAQAAAEVKSLNAQGNLRLIIFGASAREVALGDADLTTADWEKLRFSGAGSAVGEALELAATLCPDDANGSVHLFSDGRETRGDLMQAAAALGRRGLDLKIHELGMPAPSPLLLLQVRTPGTSAVGEAVTFTADVECARAGETTLTVTDAQGKTVLSRPLELQAGLQEIAFLVRPEQSGWQRYQVALENGDRVLTTGIQVGRTVLGIFETAPAAPAASALRDILGSHVEIKPLALADLTGSGMAGIDVIALADTPAAELPPAIQQNLRTWVENGGGLLVTGGRNAFGAGGYARSELAAMLPLRFPQKKEVRDPGTTVAFIIDTSGSMGDGGVNLAKEIARLAIKRLKPHDKAGIVEFHGAKRWAAAIQPASNNIALQRALNRLAAGGGTVMMPAIEEAYYTLLNVRTRTKHVLILSDGGTEQGAFESLMQRMAADGIQVSTVLVGPRSSGNFLAQLAAWGGGQSYTAPSPFKLPEVIFKQPGSSLLEPFVEKEMGVEPVLSSQLTQELQMENAPPLRGYVKTEAKDTAELLLESETGDPVLARWHYGLGRVAILTTQLGGTWAENFLNGTAAPNMMGNLIRQLGGTSPRQSLSLTLDGSGAGLDLDIRALTPEPSLAAAPLRVVVKDANDVPIATRDILPIRAHQWQTRFEDWGTGEYQIEVRDSAGEKVLAATGWVVSAPNEFTRAAPDGEKLAAAARVARDFAKKIATPPAPRSTRELWPFFAALGLISFLLMILVRRLPVASFDPKLSSPAAIGLALLVALGTCGFPSSALAQEAEKKPVLTQAEQQHIDGLLPLDAAEGRQKLKEYLPELTKFHGDLLPLCDYLATKGDDDKARQLLAVAAFADGNLTLAASTLGSLVAQPDPDLWALSELARTQEMQGEDALALPTFERALEKAKDPAARFVMRVRAAQLQYDSKRKDDARATLRAILAEPGFDQPEARNYCARIAGLHGDYPTVAEFFKPAGEGRDLMRDQIYFGQILMLLGKPVPAREAFAAALELTELPRDIRYLLDRIVSAARDAGELPALVDQWLAAEEMMPEQLEILVGVLSGELDRAGDVLKLLDRKDLPAKTRALIETPAFQERIIMVAMEAGQSELASRKYLELIALHPQEFYYQNAYIRLLLLEGKRSEAEAFFRKTIAATESVADLMKLAGGARSVALDAVAMEAATKAGKAGKLPHVQAELFAAELRRQRGDSDQAMQLLRALEKEVGEDAELLLPISEIYERYGYPVDALRLVQKSYDLTNNEKLLEKLIALLEGQQQFDQAFVLWRKLWETATEPMAIIQAQDRLLDIGSKNGSLADIVIELEERLDQGKLSDRELTMLLEIYTSVNDPVSAADVLQDLARQEGGDKIKLHLRMVQIYTECELFGRCNAVLRKLIKLDPDNRDEYLQSLTLIALERKNDGDAAAVLNEIAARNPDTVLRDSFSAGILGMMGKNEEAARIYRRSITDNPDEVETWLLWGNSLAAIDAKANQGVRVTLATANFTKNATGMYSVLLEETSDDDMFTVALDGLLNLPTSPAVLRAALRRVNERIALAPQKMFLYHLAADLHEALQQPAGMRRVLEQSLVPAEDERTIIIRELITRAKADNETDDVIRYGRSLLNTTEHLPPGESLELGTMLLAKGYSSEADAAFYRVTSGGDVLGVARDVILRYEDAGLYAKAGKLLREVMISEPYDVELLMRLAVIEEKNGNLTAAGQAYQQATDLMIGRQPRRAEAVIKSGTGASGGYDPNRDELTLYYEVAVQGLIMSATTTESRQQLLDALQQRVRTELKALESAAAFGENLADNPRLERLTNLMRRTAITFHRPDFFDPMDEDLLARYHKNAKVLSGLSQYRHRYGLLWNAREFDARHGLGVDITLAISPLLEDRGKLREFLNKQDLTPDQAEKILPLLVMCGHDDLLDQVMAKASLKPPTQSGAVPLTAAALATKRPDLSREILFRILAQELANPRGLSVGRLQDQIASAWPLLSEQDRASVVNQFNLAVEQKEPRERTSSRPLQHDLLARAGRSAEIDPKFVAGYCRNIGITTSEAQPWAIVMRWILDKPVAERPAALKQLMEEHPAKHRLFMLAQFALLMEEKDITPAIEAAFTALLDGVGLPYRTDTQFRMFFSGYQKNSLTEIVRKSAAVQNFPDPVIAHLAGADASEEDLVTRIEAEISRMKLAIVNDIGNVFTLHDSTLSLAANILAPDKLDRLVKNRLASGDAVDQLIAFLLLRRAGREVDALDALERIVALPSDDRTAAAIRSAMPQILTRYGWEARAVPFLADASRDPVATTLLPFRLHDPIALLSSNAGDSLDTANRRVYAALLMKEPSQFLRAAQMLSADKRHPSLTTNHDLYYRIRAWPSAIERAPGGLLGRENSEPPGIIRELAAVEGGEGELRRWLTGTWNAGTSNTTEIYKALAGNVRDQGLPDALRKDLEAASNNSTLQTPDIETIAAIAAVAPEKLPFSLANRMPGLIASDPMRRSAPTAALSRACAALGMEDFSKSLARWSVAWDIQNKGTSRWLRTYLETLPIEKRRETLKSLLPHMGINAIRRDGSGDEDILFTALLDHGMEAEANELLDRYLDRLRLIDARSASGSRFFTINDVHFHGGEFDPIGGDLQDAMAVALARLNRPDDYRRILTRRALLEQCLQPKLSTIKTDWAPYVGIAPPTDFTALTGTPLEDLTRALPEPDQVADIQPYLDIHLEVSSWLRARGQLSRDDQVARLCMLGKWCVQRQLLPAAAKFLADATALSEGMLTGRLWIADLHRLLGENDQADAIEIDLLRHDILPVSRVPAALAALAKTEGQPRADALAYQVAAYSNHPQILPAAIRHTQLQGLTNETAALTSCLAKINTMLLPPGRDNSLFALTGANADRTKAKAPGVQDTAPAPPKDLAQLVKDTHPSIGQVIIKGENPKLIYVPILHDDPYSHLSGDDRSEFKEHLSHIKSIADHLYDDYAVGNVLLEGMSRKVADRYNQTDPKWWQRNVIVNNMLIYQTWTSLLGSREWHLVPSSDEPISGPLTQLGGEYNQIIQKALDNAQKSGWFRNREIFTENKPAFLKQLNAISEEYNRKLDELLVKDPGLQEEYNITVKVRNKIFLDNTLGAEGPGVIFCGASHMQDLADQLEARNVSYAVVVPKGLAWPPKEKDAATIFADMMELGCTLKKCTLRLGDGTSAEITLPIE